MAQEEVIGKVLRVRGTKNKGKFIFVVWEVSLNTKGRQQGEYVFVDGDRSAIVKNKLIGVGMLVARVETEGIVCCCLKRSIKDGCKRAHPVRAGDMVTILDEKSARQ